MWKVIWQVNEMAPMITRWFRSEEAAESFAKGRKLAVIYTPNGGVK